MTRAWWIAALMAGCYSDDDIIDPIRNETYEWFPLNGTRHYEFQSDDTNLPYTLMADKAKTPVETTAANQAVYEIVFTYDCRGAAAPCDVDTDGDGTKDIDGAVAMTWRISANSGSGTSIHGYDDTVFDPPVKLATAAMAEGETVTTESGGTTFTSTMGATAPCDVPFWRDAQPEDCITWTLDGPGSPIAGTYRAIYQYGIVGFALAADDGALWRLKDYEDEDL